MIRERLLSLKKELGAFTRHDKIFILCAMLCGFCICADYSLVRPISNSIFITRYGSPFFAQAWLATVPFTFLVIALYNRLLPKYSCLKLLYFLVICIVSINTTGLFFLKKWPIFPFFFYIWKDVYVMLLFQQLWAVINSTISLKHAHYLYGLFFAVGAIGGIFGSLIPGFLALKMGSETLLLFSVPFCLLLVLLYGCAVKHSKIDANLPPTSRGGVQEGVKQIAGSKVLFFILLLVIFMQTASTFLDFQFNHFLEVSISTKDLRTEYIGRVMSLVNTCSFLMQIGGALFLLSLFGLKRIHLLIPLIFVCNAILSLFFPVLGMITLSFILIKGMDFSLFGIVKEMLYVPLKTEEKFHAKSLIDVFVYRSSKALAALFILLFQRFLPLSLDPVLSWSLILLFALWITSSWFYFRKPVEAYRIER